MLISTVQVRVVLIFFGISIPLLVESRLVGDNDAFLGAGTFVNNYTQSLECRQIYVQIYIAICRRGRGLGLRKSTVFYMDLPAL